MSAVPAASRRAPGRWRGTAAWAATIAALLASVILVRWGGGARSVLGLEQLAAGPAGALDSLGSALPFGYAFAAGMLAAVNPCGFALLPAYLGLYLGSPEIAAAPVRRLGRALAVAATMTGAFVLTFGAAGLILAAAGSAFATALPFIGIVIGLLLAGAGAHVLAGGRVYSSLGDRAAARLGGAAGSTGVRAYGAYGLAYAAASLGCALPIFLTVVGVASAGQDPLKRGAQFLLYGLGMGLVVSMLTIAAATLKGALWALVRVAGGRVLEVATGVLLVLTGVYVTAYWLALGF